MKKLLVFIAFIAFLLAACPKAARAQDGFESVTGEEVTKALPEHFEVEKTRVPVQKLNAVLLKNHKGARVIVGILDTSGVPPRIRQKYSAMLIAETKITLGSIPVDPGSYAFGLLPPKPPSKNATFMFYTKEGDELGECPARRDPSITAPKSLGVIAPAGGPTKLTFFQYSVEVH